MKKYICKKCGHIVHSASKVNPINWTDKHSCVFITEEVIFLFLDDLRESGITNMFGATPYLQEDLELTFEVAKENLINWMKQFGKDKEA